MGNNSVLSTGNGYVINNSGGVISAIGELKGVTSGDKISGFAVSTAAKSGTLKASPGITSALTTSTSSTGVAKKISTSSVLKYEEVGKGKMPVYGKDSKGRIYKEYALIDDSMGKAEKIPTYEGVTETIGRSYGTSYSDVLTTEPLMTSTGTLSTQEDLKVTYSELEENINILKKAIEKLKNSWQGETKKNLSKIESSWIGEDCKEYVTKLNGMDKKVNNVISALELLSTTYEKAKSMVHQSQSKAVNNIQNIN